MQLVNSNLIWEKWPDRYIYPCFWHDYRFFATEHTEAARKVLSHSHHPHFWYAGL